MEPERESISVEVEEDVMDDGINDQVPDTADQSDFGYYTEERPDTAGQSDFGYYAEETEERSAETDDITETDDFTVMDTQTGDVILMDGEVCSMDTQAVDIGCKGSPPLPDKAARGLSEESDQLTKNQDEFLRKTPEKLKLPKDGPWHKGESKDPAVEEKAPPIPIKKGNTKSRIDMFESM